ncbi:hypothetical protein B0T19DRAFT_482681 [Cercophora scortea]|uniref:Cellobiose dehydrogenase-like cytochrome domain-containing protein n=1 Tax=Cercophora scortea TaxID=314031 RepID=A0AAE0IW59_9PEZI|nr:hypothetical protein B0T19DRAFT_482681 [Cercophora scortea]
MLSLSAILSNLLALATSLRAAGATPSIQPRAGPAQTTPYTDVNTGISFLGWADGTGYQFGIVLPKDPKSTDFIVQLISPLRNGAGWVGIDFGSTMVGHLMIVAWPNSGTVMIAPRISTAQSEDDTKLYTANPISLSPIAKGTFVNSTHVSATFICGGGAAGGTVFGFAYSFIPVDSPKDVNTRISDHTLEEEPYGTMQVVLADAQSDKYASYAALATKAAGGSATPTVSATAKTKSATTTATAAQPASSASWQGTGANGTALVVMLWIMAFALGAVGIVCLLTVLSMVICL